MHARYPRIDYSKVRPDWAPNREFAHHVNASSTIPPFVEPWLIKVMQRARKMLPPSETALIADIDVFIAQEAQHYRHHAAFNRRLYELYPGIKPELDRIAREYDEILEKRSFKFCVAYSEGFETLGPPGVKMWFEHYTPYLEGADYEAVALWKWHMAEEFEHRTVCFRLFRALYARSLPARFWNGWLYRCYAFLYAMRHLGGYSKRVTRILIDQDRATMSEAGKEKSLQNEQAHGKLMRRYFLPQLAKVLSPFYNPANKPEPKGLSAYLSRFEKGGDMGRDETAGAVA